MPELSIYLYICMCLNTGCSLVVQLAASCDLWCCRLQCLSWLWNTFITSVSVEIQQEKCMSVTCGSLWRPQRKLANGGRLSLIVSSRTGELKNWNWNWLLSSPHTNEYMRRPAAIWSDRKQQQQQQRRKMLVICSLKCCVIQVGETLLPTPDQQSAHPTPERVAS